MPSELKDIFSVCLMPMRTIMHKQFWFRWECHQGHGFTIISCSMQFMKQKHARYSRELFATIGCLVESGAAVENTPQWKWRLLISYDGTQYSGLLSFFLKFISRRKNFFIKWRFVWLIYIQLSPTWAWCCFFIVMWRDWSLRSYRATHEIDFGHRLAIAASLYYSTTDGWGCCFQSDKMFTWPTEGCCGWTDWYRCPCLGSGKVDGLFFGYILLFATLYDSDLRGWIFLRLHKYMKKPR